MVPRTWRILVLLGLLAGCRGSFSGSSHGRTHEAPRPVPVKPFNLGEPDLVLLITGGTNGMLEVCNCTGPMPGGLARRSGLVLSYRAAFPHTFLLDTGDAFWIDPEAVQNRYVLKGYDQIGYDALVLGDQEWAVRDARLAEWLAEHPIPAVASTIESISGEAKVPVSRTVERSWGAVKLAVLSDIRRESFLFFPPERLAQLKFSPQADLARRAAELKEAGCVVVVVIHGDEECVEGTVRNVPADLYIRGHTQKYEKALMQVAGKPVVKVGKADWVGAVAMKVADGRPTAMEYRLELVDDRWPLDVRLLQTYQAYAHAAMRHELDKKRKEGLKYVPSEDCGKCHREAYELWRGSRHARAYRTLEKVGRTIDPNCLMCHTTGFGTQDGFYTLQKTPALANVNCQDCHRFNVPEHHVAGYKAPRAGEDVCTTCHTPVTDPNFDYKTRVSKVRCPARKPGPGSATQPTSAPLTATRSASGPP